MNHVSTFILVARLTALPLWLLVLTTSASGIDRQTLTGHVPEAVSRLHLEPVGRPPATNRLYLAIGLPLRATGELDRLLEEIYDPASPQFRHYLTPEQFTERFGPSREDYEAVAHFARSHNLEVTYTHRNRMLLDVSGAVPDIERAFQVRLQVYPRPGGGTFYAPEAEPSVDIGLPILHISGLDNLRRPQPMLRQWAQGGSPNGQPALGSGPAGSFLGNDLHAAYVPGVMLTGAGQSVALLEFTGFFANDITNYEDQVGLPRVPLQTRRGSSRRWH